VTRADGSVEEKWLRNIVTSAGLNRIANRAVEATGNTPFYVIAVGTYTSASDQASHGSTDLGELARKQSINTGASAQSREWIFLTASFAGNTDGLTGETIDSCALCDHPNSGSGIVGNIVHGLDVTLADSDFLQLTGRIRVGSHDISHST
jgi:hypothetical protein